LPNGSQSKVLLSPFGPAIIIVCPPLSHFSWKAALASPFSVLKMIDFFPFFFLICINSAFLLRISSFFFFFWAPPRFFFFIFFPQQSYLFSSFFPFFLHKTICFFPQIRVFWHLSLAVPTISAAPLSKLHCAFPPFPFQDESRSFFPDDALFSTH